MKQTPVQEWSAYVENLRSLQMKGWGLSKGESAAVELLDYAVTLEAERYLREATRHLWEVESD